MPANALGFFQIKIADCRNFHIFQPLPGPEMKLTEITCTDANPF
jgi:hypothetical protein